MNSKAIADPQPTRDLTGAVGPVFISYSRKDYYFAESLTLALLERQIGAWLDVKDLRPGVD